MLLLFSSVLSMLWGRSNFLTNICQNVRIRAQMARTSVKNKYWLLNNIYRLLVCPLKWKFLSDKMNMIDLIAVLPFYLSAIIVGLEDLQVIAKAGKIIRLLRIMRILRIFKMVRHFAGLQSLVYTLQQAYRELGLLFVIVIVAILLYTSLIFAIETEGPEAEKWSFYDSFWWGLMTLTTVGYDMNPSTFLGKFICGLCAGNETHDLIRIQLKLDPRGGSMISRIFTNNQFGLEDARLNLTRSPALFIIYSRIRILCASFILPF